MGGTAWLGGRNYLLNLVRAISTYQGRVLTPVIFAGDDATSAEADPFEALEGIELVRAPAFNDARRTRALLNALLKGFDADVQAEFARARIDCVFESSRYHGWRAPQATIAWMPDFQHRFLPEFFNLQARLKREIGFRAQIASGRRIMLSSEDARLACERFHPSTIGRTSTVSFAVPHTRVDAAQARAVADRHGLPNSYVFMPNQFWRHKNHRLVIEALALLRDRGRRDIVVAASGSSNDPRDALHFPALQAQVDTLGLASQFRILGQIPYSDIAPLLQGADALLNPSLFEGWSTSVEEARAQGRPMILSDLDVHREQVGDAARYFDRHSAQSLAQALGEPMPQVRSDVDALTRASSQRMSAFASAFAKLVDSTTRGAR